jgi:hypothetical protein
MPRMTHPNPGGLSRPLLVAAQTLFMLLPLIGLWLMREGKPMRLTPTKCLAVGAAIVAFSLLVVMFYDTEIGVPNWVGVGVCSGNLALRVLEASRLAQLHGRAVALAAQPQSASEDAKGGDKGHDAAPASTAETAVTRSAPLAQAI